MPERELDVPVHGHMWVERVVLEHHRDVTVPLRDVVQDPIVELDRARADLLEARDHPQHRRLPTSGRSKKNKKLSFLDLDVHPANRVHVAVVPFQTSAQNESAHVYLTPPATIARTR